MFHRVFRVEKASKEGLGMTTGSSGKLRPTSDSGSWASKRPTYVPLTASTPPPDVTTTSSSSSSTTGCVQVKKRVTIHDPETASLSSQHVDPELDLLDLVCRSDSLHRRLDELQAKYERVDNGVGSIFKQPKVPLPPCLKKSSDITVPCNEKGKDRSSLKLDLNTNEVKPDKGISKSLEEPPVIGKEIGSKKTHGIFKRLFGHRRSKSEDDLLEEPVSGVIGPLVYHVNSESCLPMPSESVPKLPFIKRRSASADTLANRGEGYTPVKLPVRQSISVVEFPDIDDLAIQNIGIDKAYVQARNQRVKQWVTTEHDNAARTANTYEVVADVKRHVRRASDAHIYDQGKYDHPPPPPIPARTPTTPARTPTTPARTPTTPARTPTTPARTPTTPTGCGPPFLHRPMPSLPIPIISEIMPVPSRGKRDSWLCSTAVAASQESLRDGSERSLTTIDGTTPRIRHSSSKSDNSYASIASEHIKPYVPPSSTPLVQTPDISPRILCTRPGSACYPSTPDEGPVASGCWGTATPTTKEPGRGKYKGPPSVLGMGGGGGRQRSGRSSEPDIWGVKKYLADVKGDKIAVSGVVSAAKGRHKGGRRTGEQACDTVVCNEEALHRVGGDRNSEPNPRAGGKENIYSSNAGRRRGSTTPGSSSSSRRGSTASSRRHTPDEEVVVLPTNESGPVEPMFQLPSRLPENSSLRELDTFLTAIIDNLESQLTATGSLRAKSQLSKNVTASVDDDNNQVATATTGLNNQTRMNSSCPGCGRRWVEPRLLPCLHTLCTPCLHHRKGTVSNTIKRRDPQRKKTENGSSLCCKRSEAAIQPASSTTTSVASSTITSVPTSHAITPTTQLTKYTTPTTTSNNNSQQINGCTTTSTYPTAQNIQQNSHSLCNSHECKSQAKAIHSSHVTVNNNNYKGTTTYSTKNGDNGESSSSINNSLSSLSSSASKEENMKDKHKNVSSSKHVADLDSVIALLSSMSPGLTLNETHQGAQQVAAIPSHDEDTTSNTTPDSTSSSRTRSTRSTDSLGDNTSGVCVVWCPECGYEAEIPPGGVECFPLNYMLQKQLVLQALNSDNTTVYCDLCHDVDVIAEHRCDNCPVNLCRLCCHAHARQRRTAHHKVLSMEEARTLGIREVAHTLVCSTHGEGEVGWWCRDCSEPLCTACLATLHRGHNTATVAQEAPHTRTQLLQLLDQATNRVGDLLSGVEELSLAASRVQQRSHTVNNQVNLFIDDYITALEEHRHTLLRQVRQTCERAQRGIVTESQRAGQTASWLRQGADLTHDLVHHAGDAETLALAPLIIYRLQGLIREQSQQSKRWERLELLRGHRAGKIRGHRIQGVIADTFADYTTSKLKPLIEDAQVCIGSHSIALLVTRDPDGQPVTHGGEKVQAHLLNREGCTIGNCSVRDREDGSYEIGFSPLTAGTAQLHVKLCGHPVQGSPLEVDVVMSQINGESGKELALSGSVGRGHTGIYHCCTFCSTSGDKNAICACGATMPGGYKGCGHNHSGHPGSKHWSCCGQLSPNAPCSRPPSQYYQVTL